MSRQLQEILHKSNHVVFFGGAGVSTESGIPDFRSETGLYSAEQVYGYPPEQLLSLRFFFDHPDIFFAFHRNNILHLDALPGPAHLALADLERRGKLRAVITQNIDGLHQRAGSRTVHELHGSALRNYCVDCRADYPAEYLLEPANCGPDTAGVPRCAQCGGIVRPDVVLYDEQLDEAVLEAAVSAIRRADTLIVGGTSLVVYPAAGLLRYFRGDDLVLINRGETPYDNNATLVIRDSIGQVLSAALD